MVNRVVMVAQHSPRNRARQTAEAFAQGFKNAAKSKRINVSFGTSRKAERERELKKGAKGLRKRSELEALTTIGEQMGLPAISADKITAEMAKVYAGESSPHFPTREQLSAPDRMGLLITRAKNLGNTARLLNIFLPKSQRTKPNEVALISIKVRHSRNKGDTLTKDGWKLAREQGAKVLQHLVDNGVLKSRKSKFPAAVVLAVSHGGNPTQAPGQLDYMLEGVTGKQVKELGGGVNHVEGLITLAYGNGTTKHLLLRQSGIVLLS